MTHYDTLEVSPNASPETIRAAYRSLMQRHHPDKNPGDASVVGRAAAIAQAYDVVSDPQRRASYDLSLRQAGAGAAARPDHAAAYGVGRTASGVPRGARVAPAPRSGGGMFWWIVLLLVAVGVGVGVASRLNKPGGADPATELARLRAEFAAKDTTEARRRAIWARKQELLRANLDLARSEAGKVDDDLRARSVALLEAPAEPLTLHPGSELQNQGSGELKLPALTLVVGSFDAPPLLAELGRRRDRLLEAVEAAMRKQSPAQFAGAQAEERFKDVVRQAVQATLNLPAGDSYPSTWYESPGRYGVVDVQLPQGLRVVRLNLPQ